MGTEAKTIKVPAESELSRHLRDAVVSDEPVLVDTGEGLYALAVTAASGGEPAATSSAGRRMPDADEVERSRAAIRQAAGSWKEVDAAAFKAYIAERRRAAGRAAMSRYLVDTDWLWNSALVEPTMT